MKNISGDPQGVGASGVPEDPGIGDGPGNKREVK
jgi:hypothetical protein